MKYLVVGLGNIGAEYELTRHNIGFLVLDKLAEDYKTTFQIDQLAYKSEFRFKGRGVHLIKPTTYMNLSGKAVNYWQQQLKISRSNTLIVTDDVALPFGSLRLRAKGSNAGHNGLKHIESTLGTTVYPRLRFGIGDNYHKGRQVDYVLSRFSNAEFEELPPFIDKACQVILSFCSIGIDRTMNQFN
jgi:PTH1 family peptidyl-tRNA hydrolase